MIIQQAMCKTVLFFINQALKLDGDYQKLLEPVVGKSLAITVKPLNWSYSVYILKDKIVKRVHDEMASTLKGIRAKRVAEEASVSASVDEQLIKKKQSITL